MTDFPRNPGASVEIVREMGTESKGFLRGAAATRIFFRKSRTAHRPAARERPRCGQAGAGLPGWLVLALLSAAGCVGHVEGELRYPPTPLPPAPGERPVPGIYFLHDQDSGAEGCEFLGRAKGGAQGPPAAAGTRRERAGAVLELAQQARALGGNVVLLPSFSAEFPGGSLTGLLYRCDPARRRMLYEESAADRRLTVIP